MDLNKNDDGIELREITILPALLAQAGLPTKKILIVTTPLIIPTKLSRRMIMLELEGTDILSWDNLCNEILGIARRTLRFEHRKVSMTTRKKTAINKIIIGGHPNSNVGEMDFY
jgi:hypothetical protein